MLFGRFSIGTLRLANRLVRSAICEGMAEPDGAPSARLIDEDCILARGGVGLIIGGMASVTADGCILPRQCAIDRDELVPAYRKLTGAVHAAGAKIALQIGHGGSRCIAPGRPVKPEAWTAAELDGLIRAFADAARRVRDAGFDAVQLHAAHGYLLSEFLSPNRNPRDDAYGGSLDSRARLLVRVLTAVRRAVGETFPVLVKINSEDFVAGGLSAAESTAVLRLLASRGLSAAEISGGVPEAGRERSPVRSGPGGTPYYEAYAAKIRAGLALPVLLVGGIRDAETAERLVRERVCDLVALGRPLIAEPDLPKKWQSGGGRAVCAGCNRCFRPLMTGRGVRCMAKKGQGA